MRKKFQIILFIISIIIHIFFYISANWTHTLDMFFEHVTRGQDFFQIPNAAYAFLHGGTLTGNLPANIHPYTTCCGVNSNVYHPFFTLLIGMPLQFFAPWVAFSIWTFVHLLTTTILLFFLWNKFKSHRYIYLALSLFLVNSYHYYEIHHAQYHFLFNFFTIFFIYESIKNGDTKRAGLWLFLSLLVKPIGLLWILPLLLYKRFKTVAVGIGLYALFTLPFQMVPFGQYYLSNFISVVKLSFPTYNLYSLVHIIPSLPAEFIKITSYATAALLIIFQLLKKPNLFLIIILWIFYQLLFYSLTFPYHYTILAGIFVLGLIFNIFTPKKILFLPVVLLTLPTPIVLFHLTGFPPSLPPKEYSMMALYSASLLILLTLTILSKTYAKKIIK